MALAWPDTSTPTALRWWRWIGRIVRSAASWVPPRSCSQRTSWAVCSMRVGARAGPSLDLGDSTVVLILRDLIPMLRDLINPE